MVLGMGYTRLKLTRGLKIDLASALTNRARATLVVLDHCVTCTFVISIIMKSLRNGAVCICGCSKLMINIYIFLRSIVIQTKRCVITKMKNAAISELIKSGFWANSKI